MRIIEPVVYAAYHQVKVDILFTAPPPLWGGYSFQSPHLHPEKREIRNWGAGISITFPFPRMEFWQRSIVCARERICGWEQRLLSTWCVKSREQLDITVAYKFKNLRLNRQFKGGTEKLLTTSMLLHAQWCWLHATPSPSQGWANWAKNVALILNSTALRKQIFHTGSTHYTQMNLLLTLTLLDWT